MGFHALLFAFYNDTLSLYSILEKFFTPYDPDKLPDSDLKMSGEWTV